MNALAQDTIADLIGLAAQETFTTMLGLELTPARPYIDGSASVQVNGVVAIVGFAGILSGTGSLCCSAEIACALSGRLLMTTFHSVDPEVLDAIGELANMIIGGFKRAIEDDIGTLRLTTPAVIHGLNFSTRVPGGEERVVVPFDCEDGRIEVHFCMTPRQPVSGPGALAEENFGLPSGGENGARRLRSLLQPGGPHGAQ